MNPFFKYEGGGGKNVVLLPKARIEDIPELKTICCLEPKSAISDVEGELKPVRIPVVKTIPEIFPKRFVLSSNSDEPIEDG
jgi:hypothetical protein